MRPHPASTTSAPLGATVVLTACLAGAGYLHRLGSEPWARVDLADPLLWLTRTPPEDVVAALLRVAALGASWWVIGTFLAALLVRAVGWRPAIRVVDRLAPRLVRRTAQRLTGGALLAASILGPTGPAVATVDDSGAAMPVQVFAPPGAAAEGVPDPSPPGSDQPATTPPTPTPSPSSAPERRVRVAPGDHLWGIARTEVARRRGIAPQDTATGEVAAYWRRVVQVNEARLRSGDADLLFPGEDVILPQD